MRAIQKIGLAATLMLCLFTAKTTTSFADEVYFGMPDLAVVGWNRLSAENQATLQKVLFALPRALAPWLHVITIDNAPIPSPLSDEVCAPNGEWLSTHPCGFNIFSAGDAQEQQFPVDAPESQSVRLYTAVIVHEYGHQIGHGTSVEQLWVDRLITEAGSDPSHYLRSMLPTGYFQQNPQEFIASMWNQWGTCSRCTLKLALKKWYQGSSYQLNQLILLIALSGFRHGFLNDDLIGMVIAHRVQDGIPVSEFWSVSPWQCGGSNKISGPGFMVILTTDELCHAISVDKVDLSLSNNQ